MSRERRLDRIGLAAALGAFTFWGLGPLFWKQLASVSALDVLSHRALWGAALIGAYCLATGRWARVRAAFGDRRVLGGLFLSAICIALNWGPFIWAIQNGYALEASLGYYVFPLTTALIGRVILGERLSPRQNFALGLAGVAVATLSIGLGAAPWIAFVLAISFSIYGLLRKVLDVGPIIGMFVESALLSPFALVWLWAHPTTLGPEVPGEILALLVFSGFFTVAPLILFAEASRRMALTTLGVLQYLNPTLQFFCAVWLFGEPFTLWHAVAFLGIWLSLALYSSDFVGRRTEPI